MTAAILIATFVAAPILVANAINELRSR